MVLARLIDISLSFGIVIKRLGSFGPIRVQPFGLSYMYTMCEVQI